LSSLNKIILIGTLFNDPDIRVTTGGESMAKVTMQVDRPERTDGLPTQHDLIWIVAWRQTADQLRTAKKGDMVLVEGRIVSRSYDDADGQKKYVTEVEAREMKTLAPNSVAMQSAVSSSGFENKTEAAVNEGDFDFSDNTFNNDIQFPDGFDAKSMAKELETDVPF